MKLIVSLLEILQNDINKLISPIHDRKNHVIYKVLLTKFLKEKNKNISVLRKQRDEHVDILEHDLRFKISTETVPEKKTLDAVYNVISHELLLDSRTNSVFH